MDVYIEIPHLDLGLSRLSQLDNILFCCHIMPNIIYHSLPDRFYTVLWYAPLTDKTTNTMEQMKELILIN